jgi:hypothetical protein
LAINCRGSTATNCIHFPVGIVIVYHVKISMSTSANNNNNNKKDQNSETLAKYRSSYCY